MNCPRANRQEGYTSMLNIDRVLAEHPSNLALNNPGWVLGQAKGPEALSSLAPNSPEIIDTSGSLQVDQGDSEILANLPEESPVRQDAKKLLSTFLNALLVPRRAQRDSQARSQSQCTRSQS
jgi:hypothetical protein